MIFLQAFLAEFRKSCHHVTECLTNPPNTTFFTTISPEIQIGDSFMNCCLSLAPVMTVGILFQVGHTLLPLSHMLFFCFEQLSPSVSLGKLYG